MSNVLENYAFYVSETISNKELNKHNFISVDNMLPNGEGIKEADYVPTEGTSIKFRRNDILIGNIRPYFKKIWMAEFDGGCSADVLCIRAKDSISPEYLLFYLSQDSFFDYVMSGSKGTRMPRGDKDHIMNFPVLEQANGKSIGEIFLNLYKKIQNNKKQIETLETIAKIIYDYWFMQLDFPNEKGKPYKSSGGKMVWNEELKKEVPEGWGVLNLYKAIKVIRGISYSPSDISECYEKGTVALLKSNNIQNGELNFNKPVYINQERANNKEKLTKNSVFITMSSGSKAHMGKTAIIYDDLPYYYGAFCSKISIKPKFSKYLSIYFTSLQFRKYIEQITVGTSINNISSEHLESITIPCPDEKILNQFNSVMEPIFSKIATLQKTINSCRNLQSFLLPLLMNGQVKFKNN